MSKTPPYKPSGYNSASPYFIVKGAQQFIELMDLLFHAKVLRRFDREDTSIMHAELLIDDSVIMLSDATEEFPPIKLVMHVYVPDVDATFRKAIALGCEPFEEPKENEGDPDRRGTFLDFAGNMWSIATQND
ncbi:MAG: hypothetical protein R2879_21700 [Saprospiraceae bacterium]